MLFPYPDCSGVWGTDDDGQWREGEWGKDNDGGKHLFLKYHIFSVRLRAYIWVAQPQYHQCHSTSAEICSPAGPMARGSGMGGMSPPFSMAFNGNTTLEGALIFSSPSSLWQKLQLLMQFLITVV
jgi:hypothetical protein